MRALLVVFDTPICDYAARVPAIPEPTRVETLIAESTMKTFHPAVLGRLSGLNVNGVDAPLGAPG